MTSHAGEALDCEVVTTRGGARAIRDRTTGEVMHPGVGPVIESATLYAQSSGLEQRLRGPERASLVLLDVGLGAGSNAVSALRIAEALPRSARHLNVVSFDRSFTALELACAPEHASGFGFDACVASRAHALLRSGYQATERSTWRVVLGELWGTLTREPEACADIVYWDPFSPRANPELWSVAAFTALRRLCRRGATVHTYSGATATRSALLLAGFAVGLGPAAGHKQATTTIAALDPNELAQPLDKRWLERLTRSSAPWPGDADVDALSRIRALAQFA
jgi:queuine tRNA-ribosyltransferase